MTRPKRTEDELWAIQMLLRALNSDSTGWSIDEAAPSDSPDLTLVGPGEMRVACEITRVGRSEWFRWQSAKGLELAVDQLDEVVLPREVDLWLLNSIAAKTSSVPKYIANASADEAWLLVHGGLNRVYDFFNLSDDEAYDIPLLVHAAESNHHPFRRIFVASANSNRILQVFPYTGDRAPRPDISRTSVLRVLTIRSVAIVPQPGVNRIAIGNEFKPDRKRMLPPLDALRLKP